MTRTCYFCAAEIISAGTHSACPECGMSYPHIPAVEPAVSAPAASPRRGLPAAGQLASGSDATSSPPSTAGASYSDPRDWQSRADAAPGAVFAPSNRPGRGNIRAGLALVAFTAVAVAWPELIGALS